MLLALVALSCASQTPAPAAAPADTSEPAPTTAAASETPNTPEAAAADTPATPEPAASPATPAAPEPAAGDTPATPAPTPLPDCVVEPVEFRTDVASSGNRASEAAIDLATAPVTVDLGGQPEWVVPDGSGGWYVVLGDQRAVTVTASGAVESAEPAPGGHPPILVAGEVVSALADQRRFETPLPDTRTVRLGQWAAALVEPTDRYGHGVLGDAIEAGGVEVVDLCTDDRTRIIIEPPSVIEGISPMLVDIDGDAIPEVLITTSNADDGARLELWAIDGERLATSPSIGRGNRWRNQLGAAATAPDGAVEIIDVRTPHIDGIVEFFRLDGDQLVLQASQSGTTSHVLGSRNLDMGLLADATDDGRADVIVLTRDRGQIAVVERTDAGAAVAFTVDVGAVVTTNIAVSPQGALAVGGGDGRLRVWGS